MQGLCTFAVGISSACLHCVHVCSTSLQRRAGCTSAPHACSAGLRAFAPLICTAELCMSMMCMHVCEVQVQCRAVRVGVQGALQGCARWHPVFAAQGCRNACTVCLSAFAARCPAAGPCLQPGAVSGALLQRWLQAGAGIPSRLGFPRESRGPRQGRPWRLPSAAAGGRRAPRARCCRWPSPAACGGAVRGPRGPIPWGPPPQPPRMGHVTASLPAPALALRPDEFSAGHRGPAAPWGPWACHARSTLCAVPAPHGHPVRAAPSRAAPPARPR